MKGTQQLRKGRCSLDNQIYHLTTATRNRHPFFLDFGLARALVHSLNSELNHSDTLAWVVMPDHFHMLVQFDRRDISISNLMRCIKARFTVTAKDKFGVDRIWQRGFYDRAIRSEEDIAAVARYIVANPLRAGLVQNLKEYPHWDAIWLDR